MNVHLLWGFMKNHKPNDKRLLILCAAEELIANEGFQGLSMHKLAKKAGVAAGTIYRYFEDKDHLICEVRLHVTTRVADAIQAGVSDDMPLKLQYKTMWLNVWRLGLSNTNTLKNRILYESLPAKNSQKTRELERQLFAKTEQMFNKGKAQGLFKPLDNDVLSGLSLETSVTLARKYTLGCFQPDEITLDAAVEASWDAIIKH